MIWRGSALTALNKPSWKLRRRATFGTLVFCGLVIVWVLIRWDSTPLAETLVLSMSGLAGTIVAAYVGFAAWEDRAFIQREDSPYVDSAVLEASDGASDQDGRSNGASDVEC